MRTDATREKVTLACHFNDIAFQEISYADSYDMQLHTHEEAHLVFSLKGTIRGAWRKQKILIDAFTLTLMPEAEPHATCIHEGVQVFLIKLMPPYLERIRHYSPLVDTPVIHQNDFPVQLAMRLYREFQNQDNLTPLILEGLTLDLMAQIARRSVDGVADRIPRWLKQAKDLLHDHFRENLSLEAIAAAVGIHSSHLTRSFRQHYRCTLGEYVRNLRVEHASYLLSTSEIPLAQIALDSGFADQGHFSRTFKRLTGMTPAQFRQISECAVPRQRMHF